MKKSSRFIAKVMVGVVILPTLVSLLNCIEVKASSVKKTMITNRSVTKAAIESTSGYDSNTWQTVGNDEYYALNMYSGDYKSVQYNIEYLTEFCTTDYRINETEWHSMRINDSNSILFDHGNETGATGKFIKKDWNDLKLTRENFKTVLEGVTSSPFLNIYVGILNVLDNGTINDFGATDPFKSGNAISDGAAKFFNMNPEAATSTLKEFMNGADGNLERVYYVLGYQSNGPWKDSDDVWIAMCDYDTYSGMFVYYYIACVNYPGHQSTFTTLVFKSDTLISISDQYNVPVYDSSDLTSIALNILTYSEGGQDKDLITEIFKADSLSPEMIKRVKQFNSVVHMINYDKESGIANVVVGPFDHMTPIVLENRVPSLISAGYNIDGKINSKPYIHTKTTLKNAEWITFGDENGLIGVDNGKLKGEDVAVASLVSRILSNAATAGGSGTVEDIYKKIYQLTGKNLNEIKKQKGQAFKIDDEITYEDGFIPMVLAYYAEALSDHISKQNLKNTISSSPDLSGDMVGREGDMFYFLNLLARKSIEEYVNNNKGLSGYYKYGTGDNDYVEISVATDDEHKLGYIWLNRLNKYQRAILSEAYIQRAEQAEIPAAYRLPCLRSKVSTEYEGYTLNTDQTIDTVQETVQKYDTSCIKPSGSVTNIARVAGVAAKYVVFSSLYNNSNANQEGAFALYNDKLESLVSETWTYTNDGAQKDWMSVMPKRMEIFGTNTEGYAVMMGSSDNWRRMAGLLYNVDYAFEVFAFSELGEELGYTPEAIEHAFNGDVDAGMTDIFSWSSGSNVNDINDPANLPITDEVSINMLRSIIELHDMCTFLGIHEGDWSPTIDAYLRIYDNHEPFFRNLKDNPRIYANADIGEITVEEPLGVFFSLQNKDMSDQWSKGFALSALYVPMETNLYDANSIAFLNDPEWVGNFYYKYAFFRKALYINTDNSAIVNNKVSGEVSGTRVATLGDLLNYDRDIVLTIDDNFYNARDINEVISRLDYTAVRNTAGAEDTETDGWKQVENWFSEIADLSAAQVLKTGGNTYYSTTLATHVTKFGVSEKSKESFVDAYVLSADEILGTNGKESAIGAYEYSPKQSYGVVSAVYRSAELYNEVLRSITTDNAIFKSSSGIAQVEGSSESDWRCVYNYWMLANLSDQMKNDTASTLDLDAPIFCDVFGNIVTESGIVIIPAATNATLCGNNWTPYTVGFSEYYNNGKRIKYGIYPDKVYTWLCGYDVSDIDDGILSLKSSKDAKMENGGGYFVMGPNGELVLRTTSITSQGLSAIVQWDSLNKNSAIIKQLFYNDAYFNKGMEAYNYRTVNLIVETLRGAPIENIDYSYEGLSDNQSISKYGVYMAYKLEELTNALVSGTNGNQLGGNAVVTMPNLAFVSGIEYVVLYVFKIAFAISIVGLMVSLYLDAVKSSLGLASMGKFIVTILMVVVAVTMIPNLISWSYYRANKTLLADETGYLMMLNYVKEYDGSEIGITRVTTPETETELYIKVGDVSVDWWNLLDDVLFTNTFSTVEEVYRESMKTDALAGQESVQTKGDGLYINVIDVFDSTNMSYSPSSGIISNVTITERENSSAETVASFSMPYYVILDQLINNINEYNVSRGVDAYSYSVGSNGHILTYDMITQYLTSPEFLEEGYDILGLNRVLNTGNNLQLYAYDFDDEDAERWSRSAWYPSDSVSLDTRVSRIDEIYKYARNYVVENQNVLGKVPDEVFLKVMALQIAIEYNKQFHITHANAIEIMNVDTRDIMRFMIADRAKMYKYYAYSFPRYTYEQAGTIGVVFAALLLVLFWLTSFLKPLFMVIILGLLIFNVIGRKILFRQESKCIEGYLIGSACLVLCNYLYAVMLKATLAVASFGFGSILAMILAFILQVAYVFALIGIMSIEIKDWKNSGFHEFATIGSNIMSSVVNAQHIVVDRFMVKHNESYAQTKSSRGYTSDEVGREFMDRMFERDIEREEQGNYNPS